MDAPSFAQFLTRSSCQKGWLEIPDWFLIEQEIRVDATHEIIIGKDSRRLVNFRRDAFRLIIFGSNQAEIDHSNPSLLQDVNSNSLSGTSSSRLRKELEETDRVTLRLITFISRTSG